jgi:hypothetical protein
MAKIDLNTVSSGYLSQAALNANFTSIEDEFQNKVLYRDNPSGEPNSMQTHLDMNGFHILNAGNINPVDADSISYTPDGTGAETRTIAEKLNEVVSVKDFGAVGDAVTDDTAAIKAAIASIRARTNISNRFGGAIYFPTGIYKITDTLELATTSDVDLRIAFFGDGGYQGRGATQLVWTPATAKNGLVLKSSQMCSFEDIEFIAGNNNVDRLIYVTTQNSPVFSAFMNTFRRCSFRQYTGVTPITRLVTVAGGVLTEFDKCWFSGSNNKIRLGEDLPGTESGGGAGETIFRQCEIYHDIEVLDAQCTLFESCVFGRINSTTPSSIYPVASGFFRNDFVTINSCSHVLMIDSSQVTFFTQGAASVGLVATNNRLSGYKTGFNITGEGKILLHSNYYEPPPTTTGCVAVIIGANATDVVVGVEDFTLFTTNGFIAVDDNRSGTRKPMVIDATVGTDYTFASVGSYETLISSSIQLRGGMYRLRWAINLITGIDAADFIVRPTVDGTSVQKGCAAKRVVANTTDLITGECLVNIDGTTAAVTVALTCRQNAGAAATVKANGITYSSFFQLEELTS